MVRLAILLVLVCLSLWEWRAGVRKHVYWLAMLGLLVFFSLRYGQGTDYLTYMSIYANTGPLHTLPNYFAPQYNRVEIGYFYLMSLFKMLRVHYILFVAIITLVSLIGLHRFIQRFCPLPMFALTVFFAVYSLIYMESAIRQLLPLAIVLGWVLVDWSNGRRIRAMAGIAAAGLLHTSALVLCLLPILFWNHRPLYLIEWKRRTTAIALTLLIGAAAVINFIDLTPVINLLPGALAHAITQYYTQSTGVSLLALGNRSLFMLIAFLLAWRAKGSLTDKEKLLFNLYCVGYGVYLLFIKFDLIASRTNVYFRIVDVALLPVLFYRNRDLANRVFVAVPVMMALLCFLYVKDISSTMVYANYYSRNPIEYPYITVFDVEALLDSKFVNVKNANALNAYNAGGFSWNDYYNSLQRKPQTRSPILPY